MDIGQILKPQGIRGEVKVKALTDDPSRFCALKTVYVGQKLYRVEHARISGADVYLKLAGTDDRNAAELLRDKFVSVDRAAAVPLSDGEFFIADLIGAKFKVRGNAEEIGVIKDVSSFGAADVFTVELKGGKTMSFAFIKALDPELDEADNSFIVDGDRLAEVAVYED